MKEIVKHSIALFFRIIIVVIMSAVLIFSITGFSIVAFTDNIGYNAVVTDENGETVEQYEYRIGNGEDEKLSLYEEKGYVVTKNGIRSEMTKTGKVVDFTLSTVLSLMLLIIFCNNRLFTLGNKELNLVRCGHLVEDKFKGLKIGLLATVPFDILYFATVILSFTRPNTTVGLYKLPNFHYFKILNLIMGDAKTLGEVSFVSYVLVFLTLFIVPLICFVSYYLGYKDISIMEKITYKKGNNG